jgi:hypothetical protein
VPQFICSSCGTGLYSAARTTDLIDASCPTCGASSDSPPSVVPRPARTWTRSADHRRITNRFGAFMDRAHTAQTRLDAAQRTDADRWLDDGGSFSPAAVRLVSQGRDGGRS